MRSVHEDNQEARPATSDRRASAPHLTPLLCSIDCSSVPYPARPWEPPLNHSLAQQCVRAGVVTWITWIGRRRKKKKNAVSQSEVALGTCIRLTKGAYYMSFMGPTPNS